MTSSGATTPEPEESPLRRKLRLAGHAREASRLDRNDPEWACDPDDYRDNHWDD